MTDMQEPARSTSTDVCTTASGPPIDMVVFGVAAALAAGVRGRRAPSGPTASRATPAGPDLGRPTTSAGCSSSTSAGFVLFSGYLALTRYGNIKLGPDDSEPEFSTFSWVSMMFATGMGIGLMFWGVAEPLTHLNAPPLGEGEPRFVRRGRVADAVRVLPLGLPPLVDVRRHRPGHRLLRLPQGLRQPDLRRPSARCSATSVSEGPGKAIDVVAIFATLFGSATSLGLGALQITGGIDDVFGKGGGSKSLAVAVIAVLTACFVVSAVSGVEKGIKFLSNANAVAAALLVFFLFVVGPTVFILGTFTDHAWAATSPTSRRCPSTPASTTPRPARGSAAGRSSTGPGGSRWTPFVGHVHRPHLQGPHDPAVRRLRDPGAEPRLVRLVLDPGRRGDRPAAQPGLGPADDRRAGGSPSRRRCSTPCGSSRSAASPWSWRCSWWRSSSSPAPTRPRS